MKLRSILVMLALVASACSPAKILNSTISRADLTVTHDVAYGPHDREMLDIYRPARPGAYPVVVFFYGGSWKTGSRSIYPFVAATLARRGNVVVVPDYRLYPQVKYPVFLDDCAHAVAWVQSHLTQIGGDPAQVFLMGHSAGAYNAAMLGLDPHYLADAGTSRDLLAGVIGLAGPYDFYPITDEDAKPVFAHAADGPGTQPVNHVDGHAPPLLLVAGTADRQVRPRNTEALAARVSAKGGAVETHFYPRVGHIGLILAFAPLFQGKAPVLADVERFIAAHRLAGK